MLIWDEEVRTGSPVPWQLYFGYTGTVGRLALAGSGMDQWLE
jgi:hypothetical protein